MSSRRGGESVAESYGLTLTNQFEYKATTLGRLFSLLSATPRPAAAINQSTTRKEENYFRDYFFSYECSVYLISLCLYLRVTQTHKAMAQKMKYNENITKHNKM